MKAVSKILTTTVLLIGSFTHHPAMAGNPLPPLEVVYETTQSGFSAAVAVRHAGDGSGRLFVVEQNGFI